MSDWSMYEIEDIVWDEFGESDDHIVPHDFQKRPKREVEAAVRKSAGSKYVAKDAIQGKEGTSFPTLKEGKAPMLEKGSWARTPDGIFPGSCDNDDAKISSKCFESSNIDSISNEFCKDDALLGNRGAAIDSNLCRFRLGDISPTDSELEFFGNEHEDKESNGLLYYGWPDIGNFDEVDRMFRSCDSTFGQGNANNDDELSWFSSSSRAIDGSEDTLKSSFKSSCSESSALKSTSKHQEDGHASYGNWPDADAEHKRESVSNEQAHEVNGGFEVKNSPVTQISNGSSEMINLQTKQSKHQNMSEGNRKDRSSEYLNGGSFRGPGTIQEFASAKLPFSVPSVTQVFPSPAIPQQKQNSGPDSLSYMHTYMPYVHSEYNHSSHQIPITPATSSINSENNGHPLSSKASSYASNHALPTERSSDPLQKAPAMKSEEKRENLRQQQQMQTALTIDPQHEDVVGRPVFTDQVPVQKKLHQIQDEVGGYSEAEGVSIELPAEVDSSTVHESSCMSSVLSDELSLEATSFRKLQYVMEQLDIRTKLCIRDSLYRLARSAEQRHNFGNSNSSSSRDGRDKSGVFTTEESNKCAVFMDMETDTNPIDRSIAHLLFHRPSDPSTRLANDALSLESRTIIHGSITSQPVTPEKLVCQEAIAGGADTKFLITDQ